MRSVRRPSASKTRSRTNMWEVGKMPLRTCCGSSTRVQGSGFDEDRSESLASEDSGRLTWGRPAARKWYLSGVSNHTYATQIERDGRRPRSLRVVHRQLSRTVSLSFCRPALESVQSSETGRPSLPPDLTPSAQRVPRQRKLRPSWLRRVASRLQPIRETMWASSSRSSVTLCTWQTRGSGRRVGSAQDRRKGCSEDDCSPAIPYSYNLLVPRDVLLECVHGVSSLRGADVLEHEVLISGSVRPDGDVGTAR